MKKTLFIFLLIACFCSVLLSQVSKNDKIKEKALTAALNSIDNYKQYAEISDYRLLVRGIKYASESATLLKIYLQGLNESDIDSDIEIILGGVERLCNDIAEDIISSDSIKNNIPGFTTYLAIIENKIKKHVN